MYPKEDTSSVYASLPTDIDNYYHLINSLRLNNDLFCHLKSKQYIRCILLLKLLCIDM